MVSGQPINGFKLVGKQTEEVLVLIHNSKRHNITSQYQYIARWLQRVLL